MKQQDPFPVPALRDLPGALRLVQAHNSYIEKVATILSLNTFPVIYRFGALRIPADPEDENGVRAPADLGQDSALWTAPDRPEVENSKIRERLIQDWTAKVGGGHAAE